MKMLVPTHQKQYSSPAASHCNQCARYRNTKNDHDIGTQTNTQVFKLISHSLNILFVAFEGL